MIIIIRKKKKYIKLDEVRQKIISDIAKILNNIKYNFKSNEILSEINCKCRKKMQPYYNICTKYDEDHYNKITKITQEELNNLKDQIYSKLKDRFPDCLIQMDPLKTYILIDWN